MPVPARDAQSLKKDHKSAGEHLEGSTKELYPLYPVSQLHQGPNANTHSMGNKQEELDVWACLQCYDLIGIMEMWWDGFYDWRVGIEGYRIFRKNRQGR